MQKCAPCKQIIGHRFKTVSLPQTNGLYTLKTRSSHHLFAHLDVSSAMESVSASSQDVEVVCYDGGCASDSNLKEVLEQDLKELSDTEQRLRDTRIPRLSPAPSPAAHAETAHGAPPPDRTASIISQRLAGRTGPTVWTEFGALAAQTKGVNLGQGFPNWSPPPFVVEAAVGAVSKGGAAHQYTRTAGHMPLVALLAARQCPSNAPHPPPFRRHPGFLSRSTRRPPARPPGAAAGPAQRRRRPPAGTACTSAGR